MNLLIFSKVFFKNLLEYMKFEIDGLLMTVLDIFSVCAINVLFSIGETDFLNKHAHEHLFMIMFIVKN